jgi:hypothetical protein
VREPLPTATVIARVRARIRSLMAEGAIPTAKVVLRTADRERGIPRLVATVTEPRFRLVADGTSDLSPEARRVLEAVEAALVEHRREEPGRFPNFYYHVRVCPDALEEARNLAAVRASYRI